MKAIEAIICSCALSLALAGQSPSSKTTAPAVQADQQSSGSANGKAIASSTDRPPMANVDDQAKSLAKNLNLTEEQQSKLKTILQLQQQQVQAVIYDRSLSQEQRMDQFRTLNEALLNKIRGLLNDDQRQKFDRNMGKKNGDPEIKDSKSNLPSPASEKADTAAAAVPKLAVDLRAATYKFHVKFNNGGLEQSLSLSTTIREDNGNWTALDVVETPNGQMTDMATLEKGSLIVKKRSLKQGPVSINLDFSGNKAEGNLTMNGAQQPIVADLGGPLFADSAGWEEVVACLPLAVGYTASFRNFDLQNHRSKMMQLKVTGMESVTVPAGTFESFKVELAPTDGGPEKSTVWIASGSRVPVKVFAVLGSTGRATMNAELVQ